MYETRDIQNASNSELSDRINEVCNRLFDGNKSLFARTIDTGEANIRNMIKGVIPRTDIIADIAVKCGISPDWLLLGRGEMMDKSEVSLEDKKVETVYQSKASEAVYSIQPIPIYSISAAPGLLSTLDNAEQYIDGWINLPNAPRCDGAIMITGDSMSPYLSAGDIVCFRRLPDLSFINWGHIYIVDFTISDMDYLLVKWVHQSDRGENFLKLVSDNPAYEPVEVPLSCVRSMSLVKIAVKYLSNV